MPVVSRARNSDYERLVRQQTQAFAKNTPYHSLELGNGEVIPGIISVEQLRSRLDCFPLPQDLRGKRVLDLGAASGWNSFEAERRGAEVVAVDCVEYEELTAVKQLRGSKIEYVILDIDELTPERFGRFDYVIFFGVLYHLRHPLLALEKVCAVTSGAAFIESYVIADDRGGGKFLMEFYETDELGGQIDNWFGPTAECLAALTRSAGFPRVEMLYTNQDWRAGLAAWRRWSPLAAASGSRSAFLCAVQNNRHLDNVFQAGKDEYICIYFLAEGEITRDNVFVQIDDVGAPALAVARIPNGRWQVNVRMPPGLMSGPHQVRVATSTAGWSDPVEIMLIPGNADRRLAFESFIEQPESEPAPQLMAARNSATDTPVFRGYRDETLACRFTHPSSALKLPNVRLLLDDAPYPLLSIGRPEAGQWQVNAKLHSLTPGEHTVRVRLSATGDSNALSIVWDPA
jgi:tRNA (mo5U34)-methyltransferase